MGRENERPCYVPEISWSPHALGPEPTDRTGEQRILRYPYIQEHIDGNYTAASLSMPKYSVATSCSRLAPLQISRNPNCTGCDVVVDAYILKDCVWNGAEKKSILSMVSATV